MSHIPIVEAFVEAVCRNHKDEILAFFADDIIYHNIPMQPCHGKEAAWNELAMIQDRATGIVWDIISIAENPQGQVLTERSDRFLVNDKWIEFKVMGVFEFEGGKISAWRDYFDLQQGLSQLA